MLREISIHALREEGDIERFCAIIVDFKFLSTPSARRATDVVLHLFNLFTDFYPRPPRGGRLLPDSTVAVTLLISIHALREEGDHLENAESQRPTIFLSTPSARRATR